MTAPLQPAQATLFDLPARSYPGLVDRERLARSATPQLPSPRFTNDALVEGRRNPFLPDPDPVVARNRIRSLSVVVERELRKLPTDLATRLREAPGLLASLVGAVSSAEVTGMPQTATKALLGLMGTLSANGHSPSILGSPEAYRVRSKGMLDETPDDPETAREAFTAIAEYGVPAYERGRKTVEHICVITFNRASDLRKTVMAHIDSLERSGRGDVGMTVFDDSTGENAKANREVIEEARARGRVVHYIGVDAKRAFRGILERRVARLVQDTPERRTQILDALLGSTLEDGSWRGSPGAQRNWSSLILVGARYLHIDDDTRPATLVPDDAGMSARCDAELAKERLSLNTDELLLSGHERFIEVPIDLLGHAEALSSVRTWSAHFTGHADIGASQIIDAVLKDPDAISTAKPLEPQLRSSSGSGIFSGSTFVTADDPGAMFFATTRTRNQDFQAAASSKLGRDGAIRDRRFSHHHDRGERHTTSVRAMREEGEMQKFLEGMNALVVAYNEKHKGVVDTQVFEREALAMMDEHLPTAKDVAYWRTHAEKLCEQAKSALAAAEIPARQAMLSDLVAGLTAEYALDQPEHVYTDAALARARAETELWIRGFRYYEALKQSIYLIAPMLPGLSAT